MKRYCIGIMICVLPLLRNDTPPAVNMQVIEGTVLSDASGKPVPNAHTYVVDGEEEALTNDKGMFRIQTTKSTPLVLTVEHWKFEKLRVTVYDTKTKLGIRLKPKP